MRASEMLDDSFPHGTVEGFQRGCTGSMCASAIPCRDVHRRYHGDYRFRVLLDSGLTPAEAVARENEEAAEAARVRAVALREKRDRERSKPARRSPLAAVPEVVEVVEPKPAQGFEVFKRPRRAPVEPESVAAVEEVPGGLEADAERLAEATREFMDAMRPVARGLASHLDGIIAALQAFAELLRPLTYGTDEAAPAEVEPPTPTPTVTAAAEPARRHTPRSLSDDDWAAIRSLHAEGLSDNKIAQRIGRSQSQVSAWMRDVGLPSNGVKVGKNGPKAKAPRGPRVKAGHGTVACYARGCRQPECVEASRAYHREYVARRKAQGAAAVPAEHHGTAYGNQLGCTSREACPASPTCTDVARQVERERRRARGIPAVEERVDAEPVRAHVRTLLASGMTVAGVAETAGIPVSALKALLHSRGVGRPPVTEFSKARAEVLLAMTPPGATS